MKIIITIISMLVSVTILTGQATFKEIKSLSQEYSYEIGDKISISGERTFINITTWDKAYAAANIEVISRFKEKAQAKKDLEAINIVFEKKGNTIYFSNAIRINNIKDKPRSNLKTIINLTVPSYAEIELFNSFGETTVNGSFVELNIESKFCTSKIQDYTGTLKLNSSYGDLALNNCKGKIEVQANRTDLSLNKVGGQVTVDMSFGKLNVTYDERDFAYEINTEYTPVFLFLRPNMKIFQDLACKNCDIIIDNCDEIADESFSRKKHLITIGSPSNEAAVSKINSESENITIISLNSQASSR